MKMTRRKFNYSSVALLFFPIFKNLGSENSSTPYLEMIVESLEDDLSLLKPLAVKLKGEMGKVGMRTILKNSERAAASMIGDVVLSARASLPALCEDDLSNNRIKVIEGVTFTDFELAILYVIDGHVHSSSC